MCGSCAGEGGVMWVRGVLDERLDCLRLFVREFVGERVRVTHVRE